MAVLLDTHVFLWWVRNEVKLSRNARREITRAECYFSLASCWELAIKTSLSRISFDRPLAQFLSEELPANAISLLPIEFRHVTRVAQLPFHHRDPFDRLLIAQALEESLTIVSADDDFDAYSVRRIW
ncbi:MAG TPA: type II toxin-antitoxin system VapC family toxin [Bryobacteraceae bacterium]|jgi:PIN domain nuclease of toxin-antitoxin system